jgi:3-hydroxybutyryl-CoA dehydratase
MQGLFFEELSVGQSAEAEHTVTEETIQKFADVSGDNNPIHLDAEYAATTQFGERIAHGMLSAGFISAVIGTTLPGPGCIYLSQSLRFRRPVKIGDVVTAKATITALDAEKGRATIETICSVAGKAVIDGEALVMVPRKSS